MNRKNQVKPPSFRLAGCCVKCAWMPIMAAMLSACATPSQMMADAEVDRLCAIDGGVKVYETVTLPPEKFNKGGFPNFFRPTQKENALGPEYIFKWERTYLRKGDPVILRQHHEVIRRTDGKLLGETTLYQRGGGDLLSPPFESSGYTCPPILESSNDALFKRIFIKSTM